MIYIYGYPKGALHLSHCSYYFNVSTIFEIFTIQYIKKYSMDNQGNKASPNKDGSEVNNSKGGAGAENTPRVEADKPAYYGPESSKTKKDKRKKSNCMGCFPCCGGGEEDDYDSN